MKKRNINKAILLTITLIIAFSTVASAKSINNKATRFSSAQTMESIDPFPKGDATGK